jgi:hypothetical protein
MNLLKNRKGFLSIVAVFVLLLIFFIVRLVFAVNAARTGSERFKSLFREGADHSSQWNIAEIREAEKEVYWLEQQLILANSDSISLAVNLSDSVVFIQLRGMDLFHAKILKQFPGQFLNSMNQEAFRQWGKVSEIQSESANVPRKPIKKVKAPMNGISQPAKKNGRIRNPKLIWHFTTGNNMRVVITGVKMTSDSVFVINPRTDIMQYRAHEFFSEIIPSEYAPSLYLWLNDKDAKAIYRAVPEKGKVLFRN